MSDRSSTRNPAYRHGHNCRGKRTVEYQTWHAMMQRCNNPKSSKFPIYGARGIRICSRWLKFENFFADMGPKPSLKHSIDRIDNNGNYEPSNCRWASIKEQSQNKRSTIMIEFDGQILCMSDWDRRNGWPRCTVQSRIRLGWSIKNALTIPYRSRSRHREIPPPCSEVLPT